MHYRTFATESRPTHLHHLHRCILIPSGNALRILVTSQSTSVIWWHHVDLTHRSGLACICDCWGTPNLSEKVLAEPRSKGVKSVIFLGRSGDHPLLHVSIIYRNSLSFYNESLFFRNKQNETLMQVKRKFLLLSSRTLLFSKVATRFLFSVAIFMDAISTFTEASRCAISTDVSIFLWRSP